MTGPSPESNSVSCQASNTSGENNNADMEETDGQEVYDEAVDCRDFNKSGMVSRGTSIESKRRTRPRSQRKPLYKCPSSIAALEAGRKAIESAVRKAGRRAIKSPNVRTGRNTPRIGRMNLRSATQKASRRNRKSAASKADTRTLRSAAPKAGRRALKSDAPKACKKAFQSAALKTGRNSRTQNSSNAKTRSKSAATAQHTKTTKQKLRCSSHRYESPDSISIHSLLSSTSIRSPSRYSLYTSSSSDLNSCLAKTKVERDSLVRAMRSTRRRAVKRKRANSQAPRGSSGRKVARYSHRYSHTHKQMKPWEERGTSIDCNPTDSSICSSVESSRPLPTSKPTHRPKPKPTQRPQNPIRTRRVSRHRKVIKTTCTATRTPEGLSVKNFYANNPMNRKLGRVGKIKGTHVFHVNGSVTIRHPRSKEQVKLDLIRKYKKLLKEQGCGVRRMKGRLAKRRGL